MDRSSEQREKSPQLEVVEPNQEFQLFRPRDILETYTSSARREIGLKLEGLPDLNFFFSLGHLSKGSPEVMLKGSFYPPDPEKGYVVTNDDFDPKKRLAKVKSIIESSKNRRLPSDYLFFGNIVGGKHVTPEILRGLNNLRMLLIFPNVTFQSRPIFLPSRPELAYIWNFYPIDSGPLTELFATNDPEIRKSPSIGGSGLPMIFPKNTDYILAVKGMFEIDPKT